MTVAPTEHLSQVAQLSAAWEAEEAALNIDRLANWQARYPHDVVTVPPVGTKPEAPEPIAAAIPNLKVVQNSKRGAGNG